MHGQVEDVSRRLGFDALRAYGEALVDGASEDVVAARKAVAKDLLEDFDYLAAQFLEGLLRRAVAPRTAPQEIGDAVVTYKQEALHHCPVTKAHSDEPKPVTFHALLRDGEGRGQWWEILKAVGGPFSAATLDTVYASLNNAPCVVSCREDSLCILYRKGEQYKRQPLALEGLDLVPQVLVAKQTPQQLIKLFKLMTTEAQPAWNSLEHCIVSETC